MNKYLLIAIPIVSANLPTNLLFIGHVSRKQRRPQKEIGSAIAILHSNIKDIIELLKKARLFLKLLRPLLGTNEITMNVTGVSSKIVKSDIYEKVIRDPIYTIN